jgi:pyridoxamine 5'-phosphate oxidase
VAVTIYWTSVFRQVRIEGVVSKTSAQVSDEYFNSRPKKSQISAIISNQSKSISSRMELENKYEELSLSSENLVRPSYWGGYELKADYWEFWQGRNHRLHDRICYQFEPSNNTWIKKILAP